MSYPRTLEDYTPPPRGAGAWTDVLVEESPGIGAPTGPWTAVAGPVTIAPALPDADPLAPVAHRIDFDGQHLHGWARVTWLDAGTGQAPTAPIPLDDVAADWLCSLEDVKSYIVTQRNITAGQIDDVLLSSMIAAASDRMRSERPERTLSPSPPDAADPPITLTFPVSRTVQVPDLRELVALSIDGGDPIDLADVVLRRRPRETTAIWLHFKRHGRQYGDELAVTGLWGPTAIAPRVREAVIAWVARVFHQRTARFADNVPTPDGGVLGYFRNLPPDVKVVLDALWVPGL